MTCRWRGPLGAGRDPRSPPLSPPPPLPTTGRGWGRPGGGDAAPPSPSLAPALRSKMAALSSGSSAEGASLFNGDMEPEPPPPPALGACYAGGSGGSGDPAIPEEVRPHGGCGGHPPPPPPIAPPPPPAGPHPGNDGGPGPARPGGGGGAGLAGAPRGTVRRGAGGGSGDPRSGEAPASSSFSSSLPRHPAAGTPLASAAAGDAVSGRGGSSPRRGLAAAAHRRPRRRPQAAPGARARAVPGAARAVPCREEAPRPDPRSWGLGGHDRGSGACPVPPRSGRGGAAAAEVTVWFHSSPPARPCCQAGCYLAAVAGRALGGGGSCSRCPPTALKHSGSGTVGCFCGCWPGSPFLHEETLRDGALCRHWGCQASGGWVCVCVCVSYILPVFWGILLNFPIPRRAGSTTCFA